MSDATVTTEATTTPTTNPGFGRTRWRSCAIACDSFCTGAARTVQQLMHVAELGDRLARGIRRRLPGRLQLGGARDEVGPHLFLQVLCVGRHLDARERLVEETMDVGVHGCSFSSGLLRSKRESMMRRVATQAVTLPR